MEIGVQSGGKIALFRDYFGPGLTYVGIDINDSTKMFGHADWAHIEIGDSQNTDFLAYLKEKYPRVDIFLDDGGHTMGQQTTALKEMLPHVHEEGVYVCEDLGTSWKSGWGGIPFGDLGNRSFIDQTMVGLVLKTMIWLNMGWFSGAVHEWIDLPSQHYPDYPWWTVVAKQVKHIHWYNQVVVYEKGVTHAATRVLTVGAEIPYRYSGAHEAVK